MDWGLFFAIWAVFGGTSIFFGLLYFGFPRDDSERQFGARMILFGLFFPVAVLIALGYAFVRIVQYALPDKKVSSR